MKVVTIDWEHKIIEEIEIKAIRYDKDKIQFVPKGSVMYEDFPYDKVLGVKEYE